MDLRNKNNEEIDYGPQFIADQMLKFVRENKEKPFFVYYPTVIPHLALQAPEEDIAQYKGKWPETPYVGKRYKPHKTPKACYAAMISFMDKQVGRLMATLKECGLDDNTIIFFTSDNGTTFIKEQVDYKFFQSVGPLKGLKGSCYEGGIRVPFIARYPGKIKPGTVSDIPAANYDVMATIAELVGVPAPEHTDGISYLPTLLGQPEKQKKHEFLYWEFRGKKAVRIGKWKGYGNELYDLENDIGEKNNIAADHPDIAKRMQEIMSSEHTAEISKKTAKKK
ncbi:sulfatase-like hydrolase/transferase [Verrucomicrobiota bacterium]